MNGIRLFFMPMLANNLVQIFSGNAGMFINLASYRYATNKFSISSHILHVRYS